MIILIKGRIINTQTEKQKLSTKSPFTESKNYIHATGYVDAAFRAAKAAEDLEAQKDFNGAIKEHTKAAELYSEAARALKKRKTELESSGNYSSV